MKFFKAFLLAGITGYQKLISPFLGNHCRFYPTCSQYAKDAISLHGPITGALMATKRIFKCHPGSPGGYDPL